MILGIYGSSGFGREVYEIADRINATNALWGKIVFIDDFSDEGDFFGTKRIKFDSLKNNKNEYECVLAVGEPSARVKLYNKLNDEGIKLTSLIDPTAIVSPTTKVGKGTIICPYSTIHTGVELGDNTLIQSFCEIGHDIKVGNHTVLSPSCTTGGGTVFGERVFVGLNATFLEQLNIGDDVVIGMGSVVLRDVPNGVIAFGNPAKVSLRRNSEYKVFKSR